MNLYTVFKDKYKDNELWVLIDNSDLHNCIAKCVGNAGSWILCLDPNCPDNEINDIKIISG